MNKLRCCSFAAIVVLAGVSATAHAQSATAVASRLPFYLDESLLPNESQKIAADLGEMSAMQFQGIEPGSAYAQIFGTTEATSVLGYLNTRVKYVIGENVKLADRVGTQMEYTAFSFRDFFGKFFNKPQTIASNVGTLLWFNALAQEQGRLYFKVGTSAVPVLSSRIGIVRLGRAYTGGRTDAGVRQNTWVHEARHSDCTGGLRSDDLQRIKNNQVDALSSRSCGHLHVLCPQGHALAGAYGCDALPWGAYSIGAVYSAAVDKACVNCSPQTKKAARMMALDSLSRVLVNVQDMMTGRLGRPNMTSLAAITR
jgi:hypothetical protein